MLLSSWHRKLTPFCVSLKLKLALVCVVGFVGADVIVGGGGADEMIFQLYITGPLWLPAASVALTEKLWFPWLKPT